MRRLTAIRRKAGELLERTQVDSPPVDLDAVASSLGATIRYSPFDGELAGMLVRKDDEIVIGVNSLHHLNRQRFTIAHELGHLLLHEGNYIDRSFRVNMRDAQSSLGTNREEIEANQFAAELLMPFDDIKADLLGHEIDVEDDEAIVSLAKRYRVSVQALNHRISNLMSDLLRPNKRG